MSIKNFERFTRTAVPRTFPLANPNLTFAQGQLFALDASGNAVLASADGFGFITPDDMTDVAQNGGQITLFTGSGYTITTDQYDTGATIAFGTKLKIKAGSILTACTATADQDSLAVAVAMGAPIGNTLEVMFK